MGGKNLVDEKDEKVDTMRVENWLRYFESGASVGSTRYSMKI